MDNRAEVRDFLTTRRGQLSPAQAGLPSYGGQRRVPGLRREEVALLAGMSVDYYTRLERGNLTGASEPVLDSLCRALQLDEAERTHLLDLARTANASGGSARRAARSAPPAEVRPGVQRVLDTIAAPAYVRTGRFDLVAANPLGRALFSPAWSPTAPFNLARYLFLDERAQDLYVDWPTVARDAAAALRIEAGRTPYDRRLGDLVGELSTRSDAFRTWWGSHDVRLHRTATKRLRHPVVGELEVTGEALELSGDPGLTMITYTVEPASPSEAALGFLASWTARQGPGTDEGHGGRRGAAGDRRADIP